MIIASRAMTTYDTFDDFNTVYYARQKSSSTWYPLIWFHISIHVKKENSHRQIAFALSTSVNRRRLSDFELTERSNWTAIGDVFHFHFHSENGKSFSTSIQSKSVALTDTREDEATKRRYNFSIGQVNK